MKRLLWLFCALMLLCGCSPTEKNARQTLFCMDTVMDLQFWGADAQLAVEEISSLLRDLEKQWSVTKADSVTGRLNQGLEVELTDTQQSLLNRVETLSQRTGGAFHPRLGGVIAQWGFYSKEYRIPTEDQISQGMISAQWDLGGVVKGYSGWQAAELLQSLQIDRAILNLGGNVQTYGNKPNGEPWQIALQNPAGGEYLGIIRVYGTMAVVTSGDYQRYFEENGERYHHIIDPKTGKPAKTGLTSVTVISQDGLVADGLSTALFVMGLTEATELWRESDDFEAVFVAGDGTVYATEGVALSGCDYEVIYREN